jgi:hypothetical protein
VRFLDEFGFGLLENLEFLRFGFLESEFHSGSETDFLEIDVFLSWRFPLVFFFIFLFTVFGDVENLGDVFFDFL